MENKYYELTDMVERLGCIIDDLTERDYIEMLQDIKYRALEEAEKSIHDWWHQNDFKPPYVRVIHRDNGFTWDYGSHTCFYDILEVKNGKIHAC